MTPDSWFSSNRITVTVNLMLQKSKLEQRISQQNFTSLFHWFFSFTFDTSTTHLLITFTFCWITFLFYCSLITFAYLFSPVFLFSPVAFYTIYTRCTLWEKGKFDPQNSKKKIKSGVMWTAPYTSNRYPKWKFQSDCILFYLHIIDLLWKIEPTKMIKIKQ